MKLFRIFTSPVTYLAERLLEPSSVVGYVVAVLTYLEWTPSTDLKEQILRVAVANAAFLLFIVKNKSWVELLKLLGSKKK